MEPSPRPCRGLLAGFALAIPALASFGLAARPAAAAPAEHESPRAYCARIGYDDTLRSPPPSLAPAIRRLFNVNGPHALKSSYYRCAGGAVLVCWVGANLPCGKASTSKTLPAAAQWCAMHANSDFIPMYVTGHDTLYSWHCANGKAAAGTPVGELDARGFFLDYWKKL
jgi:hypothetical protein